jgi:hypothetical protein
MLCTFPHIHGALSLERSDLPQLRLNGIAAQLKRRQQPPTASALAASMNLGRSALYRQFGAQRIRHALRLVRNDAQSAERTSAAASKRSFNIVR